MSDTNDYIIYHPTPKKALEHTCFREELRQDSSDSSDSDWEVERQPKNSSGPMTFFPTAVVRKALAKRAEEEKKEKENGAYLMVVFGSE